METGRLPGALKEAIVACGYFPEIIEATVARALGSEEITASVVHHEATFDVDELHRHATVLLLTPTRLLVSHTDDAEATGTSQALSTIETIPVRQIRSVSLTNVVSDPARYRAGDVSDEAWLSVGWGIMRRIEIQPATCGDPACQADHGYDGQELSDDLTVRMSKAADGEENVRSLVDFATALQQVAG